MNLNKDKIASFIQSLMICRGVITSNFSLSNGFKPDKIQYHEGFFRIYFIRQEDLDRFHSMGFKTTQPSVVRGD